MVKSKFTADLMPYNLGTRRVIRQNAPMFSMRTYGKLLPLPARVQKLLKKHQKLKKPWLLIWRQECLKNKDRNCKNNCNNVHFIEKAIYSKSDENILFGK
jgi:hypothetical protein